MIKLISTSLKLTTFFAPIALMANVYMKELERLKTEEHPEKAPHSQQDAAVQPKLQLPGQFQRASALLQQYLANPTTHNLPKEILNDFAYDETRVALNPYLVKALVEKPEAREYLRMIKSAAAENGLDWRMCANQLFRESYHFKPEVINGTELSGKGAIGMAQFMEKTAAELYGADISVLTDPKTAIPLYAKHMADLREEYNNDTVLALIAYNGGKGAVSWIRDELDDPDANGAKAMAFLQDRYETLGNTSPNAYHVETRRYVYDSVGVQSPSSSDPREEPEWVLSQNERLNNPLFVAGLLDEEYAVGSAYPVGVVVASSTPVMNSERPPERPVSGAVETSKRPEKRPDSITLAMR